jgi:putative membrane protein
LYRLEVISMTAKEFFELFTYIENWDMLLNLLFIGISVLYLLVVGPLRHKIPGSEPVKGIQKFWFLMSMIVYYFALGSPLNMIGHELFSMHMLQMSLLYIVLPPMLLLGIPAWFVRPLLKIRWLSSIGSILTRPMVILFLFNGLISLYHFPYIFDTIMESELLHYVSHTILMVAALCMWWSVIGPIPERDTVKPLHKLAFIFANGALLTPACALIMFSDHVLFAQYVEGSTLIPIMKPIDDQQLGGVIMKVTQEVVYIIAIGFVFSQWLRQQRLEDQKETEALLRKNNLLGSQE